MNFKVHLFLLIILLSGMNGNCQNDTLSPLPRKWDRYKYADKPPTDYYSKTYVITNRRISDQDSVLLYEHGMRRSTPRTFFVGYFFKDSVALVQKNDLAEVIKEVDSGKDILFYINGHGKNIYQMIYRVWELDQTYNLNIILFDWPTNNLLLSSTIRNAKKSVKNFTYTMDEFTRFKFPGQNVSMVFHSMGNHILKTFVKRDMDQFLPENSIDNLIISSAAVKFNKHAKWVTKIDFAEEIYLTFNNNDRTLQGASILRFNKQLGLQPSLPYAGKVNYVDFTPIVGEQHTYFINRNNLHENKPEVKEFFDEVFHGEESTLNISH